MVRLGEAHADGESTVQAMMAAKRGLIVSLIGAVHGRCVASRRSTVLARSVSELLEEGDRVLDVGCGDGEIDALIMTQQPGIRIEGLDILVRPHARIPVKMFDGSKLPCADKSWDVVMFLDVLHHTTNPIDLLREALRVARRSVLIKDHLAGGWWSRMILGFMDWVGNRPHGVKLEYEYWSAAQWAELWARLALRPAYMGMDLGLYPVPFKWLFERGYHFLALLRHAEP